MHEKYQNIWRFETMPCVRVHSRIVCPLPLFNRVKKMEAAAPLYANLLPELLIALVGLPGDVFVPATGSQGGQTHMELADVVDWVTAADRWLRDRSAPDSGVVLAQQPS